MNQKFKIHIIREKKQIKKLLTHGNVFKTPHFIFHYLTDVDLVHNLSFLISIPKKKIKLAVNRNYLKRIFKSFIYKEKKNLLTTLNTKIIFIAVYTNSSKIKYTKLADDIVTFLANFKQ